MRLSSPELLTDLRTGALGAVASGVLGALLFAPFDCWFLAPVALTPLLLVLRRTATLRAAAYLALLYGWVFAMISLHWLWSIFGSGAVGVCVLVALPWALFGLAYRHLAPRLGPVPMVLMTPLLFTAVEWLRCQGWYFRFSWLQLGTAYVAAEAGQSTYPLLGVYGMTFLTVLVNAAVAAGLAAPDRRARWQHLAGATALVAALALGFRGMWLLQLRHQAEEATARPLKVLMVQSEDEDLDYYIQATRDYRQARPDLIVWPELAVNDFVESNTEVMNQLRGLARSAGATLVAGCKSRAPAEAHCDWLRRRAMEQTEGLVYYNSALILDPKGQTVGWYHKRHPIQFFADGVPGEGYPTFATPAGTLGVAICYDLDFAGTALALTRNGAELLVVPTYDARNWGRNQQLQHARLALARAAEVGRFIVRPTSSGVSQIIGPGGEQLTYLPHGPAGHVLGRVETRHHLTPYVRGMWLLPLVCLAISLVMLVASFLLPGAPKT